jgi:hypothetical protein
MGPHPMPQESRAQLPTIFPQDTFEYYSTAYAYTFQSDQNFDCNTYQNPEYNT